VSEATKAAGRPSRPSLFLGAAHLAALWALAFLQPMLALLGDNPEFFIARGNTTSQIIIYALSLAIVPPLAGLGIEAIAQRFGDLARWRVHLFLMWLVGSALALQSIKRSIDGWPAGIILLLAALAAAAGAYAYDRWKFPRAFMDVLTPAPVIILLFFFLFSDTSKLILPKEQPEPAEVTVGNPAPVVMVMFDEFPTASLMDADGRIDGTRYPAFAEVAADSTWYRNASARGAYTPLGVPAILTGRTPDHEDLPIASDHPRSLFTLLGNSYRMRVFESSTRVCPDDLCPRSKGDSGSSDGLGDLFADLEVVSRHLLLPQSMRRNLPDISKTFGEFTNETEDLGESEGSAEADTGATGGEAIVQPERTGQGSARRLGRAFAGQSNDDVIDSVDRFARGITGGAEPVLDLIHVEKPHYPWRHIPDGQRYTNITGEWSGLLPNDGPWMAPPHVVDIALQRHLLEVGFTDTLLSRIVNRLKRQGLWDEALVVVTADHGVAFQSKVDRRTAVPENLGEIASVPLFIKAPGQDRPEIEDDHVCVTDILPEVADLLEIDDFPWEVEDCPADKATVLNSPAGEASVPVTTMVRQRDAQVDRIQRVFGTGVGWGPTYRFGPHRDLIGRKVANLNAIQELGKYRVLPDRRNSAKEFDPDSTSLLALLQRGLTKRFGEDKVLAVAVDGRIQAVGWTFKDGSGRGPGYSILLPPESRKAGFNLVDIYLVEENGTRLQKVYSGAGPPVQNGDS
jgi:hypothetical protein